MNSLRALTAAILFCAVVITVGLSAAPRLHDWLHKPGSGTHECAATLMSSGSWEHSASEPVLAAPKPAAVSASFVSPGVRVIARVDSSILEHAPPANS
ncbi:MAG: hypothetical protein H0U43_00970 [Chthoniobacterales bacterium]|nr:hypothetical protein [Chthoniobacterales bacterium]